MRVILQRSKDASVSINKKIVGKIDDGYVALVGFKNGDSETIVKKMVDKIINLRVFTDDNDKMNLSLIDVNGSVLSISQFTLYAILNGRRPSFSKAMAYEDAKKMYNLFNEELISRNINVQTGEFGEDMKVTFTNDGPVTITIDSEVDL